MSFSFDVDNRFRFAAESLKTLVNGQSVTFELGKDVWFNTASMLKQ